MGKLFVEFFNNDGLGKFKQKEGFIFLFEKMSYVGMLSKVFVKKFEALFWVEELFNSPDANSLGASFSSDLVF